MLIVDDDAGIRSSLARIMRAKGFEVETVADGESAVATVARGIPGLVILDCRLPGIDGWETMQQIRNFGPSVPVILMTAYRPLDRDWQRHEVEAVWIHSKPVDIDALMQQADSLVEANRN